MDFSASSLQRWLLPVWICLALITPAALHGQDAVASSALPDAPAPQQATPPNNDSLQGKQTKRILGIVPNFRSVSVDLKLPPQTVKEKFLGATQDSFDYSSFIFVGILARHSAAQDSYPSFGQGASGYGQYYWHTFVDQTDENYSVKFLLPSAIHQDPRYYTLGRGGIIKRTASPSLACSLREPMPATRRSMHRRSVRSRPAAGISDLYYPSQDQTWTKTGQRWLTNVSLDGLTFVFKEFWPDVNSAIFHQKN